MRSEHLRTVVRFPGGMLVGRVISLFTLIVILSPSLSVMLSEAKHLTFPLKGRLREESRLFKCMRPFTEFTLRLFTSFRVTIEGFRVTSEDLFPHLADVKKR